MLKKLNNDSWIEKKINSISKKTKGIIFGVSTITGLIIAGGIENSGPKFENPIDAQRYEQLVNEFSFENKGFIKTIQDKNPKQILNNDLKKHENKILRIARQNINKGNFYFGVDLSKENITDIKAAISSLTYLMDAMYGEGYSEILTDGLDHSDKIIVVDIKQDQDGFFLRKLSIENKVKNEQINNEKIISDDNIT